MKNKVVIFGAGKIADVVGYYMAEDESYDLLGFTVDNHSKTADRLNNLPIWDYETFKNRNDKNEIQLFVAIGYHNLNRVRSDIIERVKSDGFKLTSYIHPKSGIPNDLEFGENTFIMDDVLIHPRVKLGANNFIWSGAMIGHHSEIGDHNWFTSSCQVSGNVKMGSNNFFAVNSTVGHSVEIGSENFFGANSLVTKKVNDKQVFIQESTKAFRLNSDQFLRFSNFGDL